MYKFQIAYVIFLGALTLIILLAIFLEKDRNTIKNSVIPKTYKSQEIASDIGITGLEITFEEISSYEYNDENNTHFILYKNNTNVYYQVSAKLELHVDDNVTSKQYIGIRNSSKENPAFYFSFLISSDKTAEFRLEYVNDHFSGSLYYLDASKIIKTVDNIILI